MHLSLGRQTAVNAVAILKPCSSYPVPGATGLSLLSSVLFFGHDELLLLTRGRIFELAGFHVCFAQELPQVSELIRKRSADLIVLCHSLSQTECDTAASIAEHERIQVLRLLFTEEECRKGQSFGRTPAHSTFNSTRGPIALLEEACYMLRTEQRWTPPEAVLAFAAKGGLA
jgi:hypothetical protein